MIWLPGAGLAVDAADEGIRLRLSDQLSEDVRDEAPISEESTTRDSGRLLPAFSSLALGLNVAALHDDNVLRSNVNEVSSPVLRTAGRAMLDLSLGRHDLNLGYRGEYAHHFDISEADYFDHEFIADADLRLSRRLNLGLDTGLLYGHDRPGDFSSRDTTNPDPDRWRRSHAGINATFGRAWASASRTRGGLGIGYQYSETRYLNNDQGSRDFDRQAFALKGRYNLGPKLSLVLDSGVNINDYTDPTTPLDSTEVSGLLGVAWDVTAKTSGEVKVGILEQNFDDPSQSDFSGANFNIKAQWSPKTYSIFTVYASRNISDTAVGGGSALVDIAGLRWRHGFSERFNTETGVQFLQADYESGRKDDFYKFDLSANYRLGRRIELRGGFEYETRDSTDPSADYDDSIVFVEIGVVLERGPGGEI